METDDQLLEIAQAIMVSALATLNRVGATAAAIHLQQAICVLRGDAAPLSVEEVDRFLSSPEALAILDRWADRAPPDEAK